MNHIRPGLTVRLQGTKSYEMFVKDHDSLQRESVCVWLDGNGVRHEGRFFDTDLELPAIDEEQVRLYRERRAVHLGNT